ncbi:unnamed protein product [Amoebophrya sp. A120]|nr:unnamed protein product [Amoebophrya sp. A120]|eukprot:GSA120T00022724001.1
MAEEQILEVAAAVGEESPAPVEEVPTAVEETPAAAEVEAAPAEEAAVKTDAAQEVAAVEEAPAVEEAEAVAEVEQVAEEPAVAETEEAAAEEAPAAEEVAAPEEVPAEAAVEEEAAAAAEAAEEAETHVVEGEPAAVPEAGEVVEAVAEAVAEEPVEHAADPVVESVVVPQEDALLHTIAEEETKDIFDEVDVLRTDLTEIPVETELDEAESKVHRHVAIEEEHQVAAHGSTSTSLETQKVDQASTLAKTPTKKKASTTHGSTSMSGSLSPSKHRAASLLSHNTKSLPPLRKLLHEWSYLEHPEPEARVSKPPIEKPTNGPAIESMMSFMTLVQDMCKPLEDYDLDNLQLLDEPSTLLGEPSTTTLEGAATSLSMEHHSIDEVTPAAATNLHESSIITLGDNQESSIDAASMILQRDLSRVSAPSGAVNPYLLLDNDPNARMLPRPEGVEVVDESKKIDPKLVEQGLVSEDYTAEWAKMTAKVYSEKSQSWMDDNCLMTAAAWKVQSTEQQRAYLEGMADCLSAISKGRVKIFENPTHVELAQQMRPAGNAMDHLAQAILMMQRLYLRGYAVDGVDYQFRLRSKYIPDPFAAKQPTKTYGREKRDFRSERIKAEIAKKEERMQQHLSAKKKQASSKQGAPDMTDSAATTTRKLPALQSPKKPKEKRNAFLAEMERRSFVPVHVTPQDLKKRRRQAFLEDSHLSEEARYDMSTNHNSVQRKELSFEPLYVAVRSGESVEQVRELVALQNPLQARASQEEEEEENNRQSGGKSRRGAKKKLKDLFSGFASLEDYKTPEMQEYQSYPTQMVRYAEWVFQEFGSPDRALRALDMNGNGILSLPEFLIAMKKRMPLPFEVDLKLIFNQLDIQRKGLIMPSDVLVLTRIMELREKIEHDVKTGQVEKMLLQEREDFVSPFRAKVHRARNAIQLQHSQFMSNPATQK